MNRVILVIEQLECGRSEAAFKCEGDINKWCSKVENEKWFHTTQIIYSDIIHDEVYTFYYESHLENFVDRFKNIVDEIVTI